MDPQNGELTKLPAVGKGLLQHVFEEFDSGGEWPISAAVELDLEEELETAGGLLTVARQLGLELIACDSPVFSGGTCRLSARGIASCAGGQVYVDQFLALV